MFYSAQQTAGVHTALDTSMAVAPGQTNVPTCFYCGNKNMAVHRLVCHETIQNTINKQREAGINDIVLNFTQNLLTSIVKIYENEDKDTWIVNCMCCYHWVTRRSVLPVPPLPMQNLLWFMSCLEWYDDKKCDKRILVRLAAEVSGSDNNIYKSCFLPEEVAGLRCIINTIRQKDDSSSCCIKRSFAQLYQRENGNSILLPNRELANLLRPEFL